MRNKSSLWVCVKLMDYSRRFQQNGYIHQRSQSSQHKFAHEVINYLENNNFSCNFVLETWNFLDSWWTKRCEGLRRILEILGNCRTEIFTAKCRVTRNKRIAVRTEHPRDNSWEHMNEKRNCTRISLPVTRGKPLVGTCVTKKPERRNGNENTRLELVVGLGGEGESDESMNDAEVEKMVRTMGTVLDFVGKQRITHF